MYDAMILSSEMSFWKLLTKINFKKNVPSCYLTQTLLHLPQINIMLRIQQSLYSNLFKRFKSFSKLTISKCLTYLKTLEYESTLT